MEGERSDGAKTLTVFTGKEIVLIDETSNVYATAPQPGGVDDTIVHFVRDLGMRLPLAVLLVSQLPGGVEGPRTVGRLRGEDEHPRCSRPIISPRAPTRWISRCGWPTATRRCRSVS